MKKFTGTIRFGNDHFGAIMGYGNYVITDNMISRVYYMEGLGHNLFSVGQFCDSDLEVAFKKHACYVRNENGVYLLTGSCGSNMYTISVEDMLKSSPICLLSKVSKNKSWLWHRRLNHLNFGTINDLERKYLVRGLPRLKFDKDHVCSACQLGKSRKYTHKPKSENTIMEVLHTLHMDLCGPMRVQSINGKKYILVIVDDYSRFTWVKYIRTVNDTEFVNQVLTRYYENVGIFHQKSIPRTPQQNDIVERQNWTLVEATRIMLIFLKALMFLWAEAIATTCYTQNRSLIHTLHNKTPYDLPILRFSLVMLSIGRVIESTTKEPDESWKQFIPGLVPNPVLAAPYVPPTNKYLEILFQPMFDAYLEPSSVERSVPPTSAVQVPVFSTGVAAGPTIKDNPFAQADNDTFINVFAPEPSSKKSSSGDVSSAESTHVIQPHNHLRIWSKDHPIDNVISNPSLLVSTRKQLATNALSCLYNSVLSKVEPKNVKTAMDEVCWFESMQEEIHKFDRL
ncbi:retrovirus-related pol polyprotein from transposon TNT 1-94 [Tanacetum coccineum]